MEKVSVYSAGRYHIPVMYGCLPINPPRPLCGLVRMGEEADWSDQEPNCEACARKQERDNRKKAVDIQIGMEI